MTEYAFLSLSEVGQLLRAGKVSARQLAEYFLDRLETRGTSLNAVVTVTKEAALEQADQADRELKAGQDRGPLHGIPYGLKDLFATPGIPTTWGAAPYRERILDENATVYQRLKDAGAVLVAKLAMVEIAGGMGYRQANAALTGPGLNPWNTDYWAGGSSSGSGAAVAAGLVPFALGTETWGSIMCPASFCGIAGLRPTYGRVSRAGAMALSWSMDKIGPMARSAEDCALVLEVIAGPDPLDESAVDAEFVWNEASRSEPPYQLAIVKGSFESSHPGVKSNFERSLATLEKIGTITEIEMSDDLPWHTVPATIIDCEIAAAFEGMVTSGEAWELTAPEDHHGAYAGQVLPAVDYINALRIRRHRMQPAMSQLVSPFDAVVTPSRSTPAYSAKKPFRESSRGYSVGTFDGAANACGLPALTVPNGLTEEQLPTGVQFTGQALSEATLLSIAAAYQEQTDWHRPHPPE
ncbi:MAG: amidase [Planctomycetaceae bacterium]|nr:amidase [Planctomycetaceae bacterium]